MSAPESGRRESVYVWQLPVRLVHWTIVVCIVVLAVTGTYVYRPFLIVESGNAGTFIMGTVRSIHEFTAFVFTIAVLVRIYWGFVGNEHARWWSFVPHTREQGRNLLATLRYYLFIQRRPPRGEGHNALAGLTYLGVYVLFMLQILTGFGLLAWVFHVQPWTTLFGWTYRLVPIADLRLYHLILMFLFIAFTIHHVYSAVVWDIEHRNGLISSMVTGFKNARRGAPDDAQYTPATIGYWVRRARGRRGTGTEAR